MNKLFVNSFVALAVVFAACSGKKEEAAEQTDWPEMDAFHMIMAESFHPFKDSANLAPAKAQAAEMAANAATWAGKPLPKKVDNDQVKEYIANLKTETAAFAQLVQTGTDEEIGKALTDLHDLFHAIQEAWYGKGEGQHEHKH
ncbi:MAG: hypothetical protein HRU69_11835 [Flammeovirgaceae bacterium]|nr:MAG: hypothetical protein HRU69_11835 [Flammeovirgaceae bacterium]